MTAVRIAAFMFHEVTADPATSGFQRPGALPYKHSPEAFERHLEAIAGAPVAPSLVGAADLTRPGSHLFLTFDDGGKSALLAAERLERRGWRGHFFIVTSLIGDPTFLDAGGVRALRAAGHVIGSHSHTHPSLFRGQSPERMLEEWRVSCDVLAQLLGEPCVIASVPGGDVSAQVFASAEAAGIRWLFTSEPWLTPRRTGECTVLGRFSVKAGTAPARTAALARFHGWTGALWRRRLKVWATLAAPPLYRLYLRARTRPTA